MTIFTMPAPKYRQFGRITIILAPGEPMPAWLRPSMPDLLIQQLQSTRTAIVGGRAAFWPLASLTGDDGYPVTSFDGEDITLPPLEDQA